jgi:hypothetical protein
MVTWVDLVATTRPMVKDRCQSQLLGLFRQTSNKDYEKSEASVPRKHCLNIRQLSKELATTTC